MCMGIVLLDLNFNKIDYEGDLLEEKKAYYTNYDINSSIICSWLRIVWKLY